MPKSAIGRCAIGQDERHGGERDDVVDDGRLAEQALMRRQRRLGAHLAAIALQAFQQRGFLAADIGAGAERDLDVESEAPSRASAPKQAARARMPIAARKVAIACGYSERM